MNYFPNLGHKISSDGEEEIWRCSCWFRLGSKDEKLLMATFERRSRERPLCTDGFYSFVEDWDREEHHICCSSAVRVFKYDVPKQLNKQPLLFGTINIHKIKYRCAGQAQPTPNPLAKA